MSHKLVNPSDPELSPCTQDCPQCLIEKDEWFARQRPISTTMELLELHRYLGNLGRDIMSRKNSDYANPEKSADPFRNFGEYGAFGILVRLSDKLARLRVFIEKSQDGKEFKVTDEKWEDTLVDAINYLVLLDGYIRTHGVK